VVVVPATKPHAIVVATDTGLLETADTGKTWRILGNGIPSVEITGLALDSAVTPFVLRASTWGRSVYQFVNSSCGGVGQPCCLGSPCNSGLVCENVGNQTVCSCGNLNQPCCQPGSTCSPAFSCDINQQCTCGGLNEPCCAGQPQCSTATIGGNTVPLACSTKTFTCITTCQTNGSNCCGNTCYGGLVCVAGKCECGGLDQECCAPGGTCGYGLTCADGFCHGTSSSCGQCKTQNTSCIDLCGPPSSSPQYQQCSCNCSNFLCDCYKASTCGISCPIQNCGPPSGP
jgi:hypothetical protein